MFVGDDVPGERKIRGRTRQDWKIDGAAEKERKEKKEKKERKRRVVRCNENPEPLQPSYF